MGRRSCVIAVLYSSLQTCSPPVCPIKVMSGFDLRVLCLCFANKAQHASLVLGEKNKEHSGMSAHLCFLLFSLSPGVFCFSELFFIKEPRDVTVMRRDSVILDCQAHGESPIDVRWLKNGVSVAQSERVYLLSNGSLYISEVESRRGDKSDEGLYQCLAQNKYGAILSQKARLTIASKCVARNHSAVLCCCG